MSSARSSDHLVRDLAASLAPRPPLFAPWIRASIWLVVVAIAAAELAVISDLRSTELRLSEAPDMWLAVLGSVLTMVTACIAAFQSSVPDRSRYWSFLPLPPLLLWLGASGLGCLRAWVLPGTDPIDLEEAMHCLKFITATSLPLSMLLLFMLRRGFSLRPSLTAALGGLAAASASASVLTLVHPYDATATDLSIHLAAVLIVILLNLVIGNVTLRWKSTVKA